MAYDKNTLIKYRIDRCKESIKEALLTIDNKMFFNAENRIYYAIFYIVSALALKNDFSTSKHYQLLGWFNKNFVKTNLISQDLGKIYYDAFEKRQEGDYKDLIYFTDEEVREDFKKMLQFVEAIEKLIAE